MIQDLTGGYCPKCDTMWTSSGRCNCNILYRNTKEGMHETAKLKNIKAWSLGCSCDECVKEFDGLLDKLPTVKIVGIEKALGFKCVAGNVNEQSKCKEQCDRCKYESFSKITAINANQLAEDSSLCRMIWNEAIEAAALIGEQDHGSYCEETGNEIRKLKK